MFLEKSLFCWHGGMRMAVMPGTFFGGMETWDREAFFRGTFNPHATMPGMPLGFKLFCQKLGLPYYATKLPGGGYTAFNLFGGTGYELL